MDPRSDSRYCEIVAEIGSNHQGDLATAVRMVHMCAQAGADAVKLQKRDNRALYTRAFYDSPYNSENAFGPTYGAHREALEFGAREFGVLLDTAHGLGLDFYCTAFDEPSLDFCVDQGVDAVKMASGSLTNVPLLYRVREAGLPVYLSTGGAAMVDVHRALLALWPLRPKLLQCTASYPCASHELDLGVVARYAKTFPDLVIGASLHDNGIWSAVAAYVLGARTIEKHVTLDRTMKGTDQAFSLEPRGLAKLVRDVRRAQGALGADKHLHDSEVAPILKMSGSLFAARPLSSGTLLGVDDIVIKSPGGFLAPYEIDTLLGQRLLKDLTAEEPFTKECVDAEPSLLPAPERRTTPLGV